MSEPAQILCTGRFYCDLVFSDLDAMPEAGKEVFAGGLKLAAGGGAYITAAYLTALGQKAGLAAILPGPPFVDVLRDDLHASGVDLSWCEPASAEAEPQITVAMVAGGERAFLTRRSGRAVPAGIFAAIESGQYSHLHIGELATLFDHSDLVTKARAAQMTLSLDCSWDGELLKRSDLADLTREIDVFLPNRAEADALAKHRPLPEYAPLVVVKDGARGAQAITPDSICGRPAKPAEVIDTTGAGDAFNAGFLNAWLSGFSTEVCLEAGVTIGAIAVGQVGGACEIPALASSAYGRPAAE